MGAGKGTGRFIVAIDGPSGAGKGTVGHAIATRLGCLHVDTGAMYRAVAWKAIQDRLALDDAAALSRLASECVLSAEEGRVVIDGHDVTRAIRTAEVDKAAALMAGIPGVRAALVARQRALGAAEAGVVMEGRDIGTVVFPDADVKIYLDAAAEERARRRARDRAAQGTSSVAQALAERDTLDRTRKASPLSVAPDAAVIDTTDLGIEQVVERVLGMVEAALERRSRPRTGPSLP